MPHACGFCRKTVQSIAAILALRDSDDLQGRLACSVQSYFKPCLLHAASKRPDICVLQAASQHQEHRISGTCVASAAGPVLIVAPTSLLPNWGRELARFAPSLDVCLHHGSSRSATENKPGAANKRRKVLTATTAKHASVHERDVVSMHQRGERGPGADGWQRCGGKVPRMLLRR